jgi:hypothetical protein
MDYAVFSPLEIIVLMFWAVISAFLQISSAVLGSYFNCHWKFKACIEHEVGVSIWFNGCAGNGC